jgi:hypothetical protein
MLVLINTVMDLDTFFTFIIVLLGSLTVVLSVVVATSFRNYSKHSGISFKLAHAIKWQLAGEAVIGLGTLAFAILSYFDLLGSVSTFEQSMIRLIMFVATSFTTLHLWWIVNTLKK